ncbi:MAG: sigma-70 family RNA polymerase sigma factor [Tunicatimonas sp.]
MSGDLSQPSNSKDDQQLWQDFKQGKRSAYATVYHEQVRVLFAYGMKVVNDRDLVKDSIQDLFYYLWEHRSGLGDTDNIRRYLFTALRRNLVSQAAEQLSVQSISQVTGTRVQETSPSYESQWIEQQTSEAHQQKLQAALYRLPKRQREAVFLKYYQDMSTDEMAAVMDINRRAVYKLLTKAIRNLQQTWPIAISKIATACLLCLSYFQW